jgi:diaminopimelate epimerase
MRFTKMHGAGNDYVYVDCFRQKMPANPADLARRMADRHMGIGSDGLILVCPSPVADARMRMFNADGSEAEMCGNGLRCLGKYLIEQGLLDARSSSRDSLSVEAGGRILQLRVQVEAGRVERVRVDLGEPILQATEIPTTLAGNPVVESPLRIAGRNIFVTALSLGNPHCVGVVDSLSDGLLAEFGPQIERHPAFPQRTNVEFVEVLSRGCVRQRTWERGTGETLACGSGASAACVAGVLTGRTTRSIAVELLGGELHVEWSEANNRLYLTGPAVEVFSGEWPEGKAES